MNDEREFWVGIKRALLQIVGLIDRHKLSVEKPQEDSKKAA